MLNLTSLKKQNKTSKGTISHPSNKQTRIHKDVKKQKLGNNANG